MENIFHFHIKICCPGDLFVFRTTKSLHDRKFLNEVCEHQSIKVAYYQILMIINSRDFQMFRTLINNSELHPWRNLKWSGNTYSVQRFYLLDLCLRVRIKRKQQRWSFGSTSILIFWSFCFRIKKYFTGRIIYIYINSSRWK